MVPEYSKASLGLHPLIPLYAVDCDENRSLCAEQARLLSLYHLQLG
jgi:protein disulfide-isomerase A6